MLLSACSVEAPPQSTNWSQVDSASAGGGMNELIKAARREGVVNVPAPEFDAYDYNVFIRAFEARYGVNVAVVGSAGDAAQLSDAAELDVFDLGVDTATENTRLFAPYLVFYWLEIPASLKNRQAYWYDSCGGYTAVNYDPAATAITSLTQLLEPGRSVSLDGDPRTSNSALEAVITASLAQGGSANAVGAGVDFFHQLHERGNLKGDSALIAIGRDYAHPGGRYFFPSPTVLGFDSQAVNRQAPHPAAARLWEEFLFSDTGQNLCVARGARPSRLEAMRADGVLDVGAAGLLSPAPPDAVMPAPIQMASVRAYVVAHWAAAVS